MLATAFDAKLISGDRPLVAEPKRDGIRAICLIENGRARFVTRNGHPIVALSSLAAEILALAHCTISASRLPKSCINGAGPNLLLDGEIEAGDFTETVQAVKQIRADASNAVFHVFDMVPLSLFRTGRRVGIPLRRRREMLEALLSEALSGCRIALVDQRHVATADDCHVVCAEWQAQGFEGAMIKNLNAAYEKTRSRAWLKMKREETDDLEVVNIFEGAGRFAGMLGGVVCSRQGKLLRVSSGFSDDQRRTLWRDQGATIGSLVEIAYQEVTRNCALRHPRFVRFRDDR